MSSSKDLNSSITTKMYYECYVTFVCNYWLCLWCWSRFRSLLRAKILLISVSIHSTLFLNLFNVCILRGGMIMSSTLSQLYYVIFWWRGKYVVSLSIKVIHYLSIHPCIWDQKTRIKFDRIYIVFTHFPFIIKLLFQWDIQIIS